MKRLGHIRIGACCTFVGALLAAIISEAALAQRACEQIAAACRDAGFVQRGATAGDGLLVDCVAPIMQGSAQPRRASKALPQIDPQLVAMCKAVNPRFGQAIKPITESAEPRSRAAASGTEAQGDAPPMAAETRPLPQVLRGRGTGPNIVFILTDDLAWNLVQYMPHVLKMQQQGVTFANYFVTDSLCCPSRSSIFTGRYPHDTGVFRNTGNDGGYLAFVGRGNDRATFATAISAAGYRTAMMGKYLNGYLPANHPAAPGWTTWAVAGNAYAEFNYALNQDGRVVQYGRSATDYLTDVLSRLGGRFIRQAADSPFLIEIATFAPHGPYTPAPRDADAFPGLLAPRTAAFDAAPDTNAAKWLFTHPALTDADMARIDRAFRMRAQSVLAVDKMIGELQAAVASIGEENNTYFVFSSDNGYHMGEHRLMPGKMTAYDTDIHVPLIVTGPGVPRGVTIDEIVENVDLCPTFIELAGAQPPSNIDGRSMVPLLHGQKTADWRTVALVEHRGPHTDRADPDAPAVRSGNPTTYEAIRGLTTVYVEYVDGEREYHDLAADPYELRNSFMSLSNAEKASLHTLLDAVKNCHDARSCDAAGRKERR
jgi:N-acetylglucosamine-6-sulfatase